MLNLKALTLAVFVGLLSPVIPINVLNGPQVLAQTPDERKAEADRLLQQGSQQLDSGEYQAALQSFQQAFAIYREISYTGGIAGATFGIGYAYAYLGETEKATEIFELFLKLAQENNNSELEKLARQGLQLVENLQSASQNQNNPRKAEADRLLQQGDQQLDSGEYQAALQSFQQAFAIYREISHSGGIVAATFGIGYAYAYLGESEKATEIFELFLKVAQENNDSELEKLARQGLQLVENLQSASQNQNNPRKAEADRLLQQGIQQLDTSQFREALQSWQQALEIYREIGNRYGEGSSLNNLGIAYRNLGQYQKAIEYHQQSLAI